MSRWFFFLFAAISALHIVQLLMEHDASYSKFLLMPALALWVLSRGGPWMIIAALVGSTIGDVALEFDSLFLLGMAGFAIAHIFYITYFVKAGALENKSRLIIMGLPVSIAAISLVIAVWPELPDLQIPIAIYAFLLSTTAITSYSSNTVAGVGGALFLGSDAILALRLAELPTPEPSSLWVMVPYIAGQLLLVIGAMAVQGRGKSSPQSAIAEH